MESEDTGYKNIPVFYLYPDLHTVDNSLPLHIFVNNLCLVHNYAALLLLYLQVPSTTFTA